MDPQPTQKTIILTDAPLPKSDLCPTCRAGLDRRVLSAGFGFPHQLCGRCGYDFGEAPRE